MAKPASLPTACVGVSDHGGWAVLMTVGANGKFIDRRRVELIDPGLPALPHHHEAQSLPTEEAVALVESVRRSAEAHSVAALEKLTAEVPFTITGLALRECPPLPATLAERISNYWAQNRADWVMYREALASAARQRGWSVHWYDARRVFDETAFSRSALEALLAKTGDAVGPPWQKDHKVAMAAALAAMQRMS